MRIIVPIKQVPETSHVKMDPDTGTILRSGADAVVNPLDLYAIETALRIKENYGGTVHALSMGPPQAEKAVREAIAMGCDQGTLVSDKRFGGSDTWATSYILSQSIRTLEGFDLIIAGERATDGDTAQVGPGIAAWLDIPAITYVAKVVDINGSIAAVERLIEEGYQKLEVRLPALFTVVKEIADPRLPTLDGKKRSMETEVSILNKNNIDLESTYIGLRGSPTKVVKIKTPRVARKGKVVRADEDLAGSVSELVSFLKEKGFGGDLS